MIPLKKIQITGKDAKKANWLSKQEAAAAIASGRFDVDCQKMTVPEVVAAFADWSPIVRSWAGEERAKRPEAQAMMPELIRMAQGEDAAAKHV